MKPRFWIGSALVLGVLGAAALLLTGTDEQPKAAPPGPAPASSAAGVLGTSWVATLNDVPDFELSSRCHAIAPPIGSVNAATIPEMIAIRMRRCARSAIAVMRAARSNPHGGTGRAP